MMEKEEYRLTSGLGQEFHRHAVVVFIEIKSYSRNYISILDILKLRFLLDIQEISEGDGMYRSSIKFAVIFL